MAALPLHRDVGSRRRKVRSNAPSASSTSAKSVRPTLAVVPRRRRWPALVAVLLWSTVFAGLLGAAVFHTQLAERQLHIDRLERSVAAERERFDELRYERAELRSPVRLASAASALGMERGDASEFIDISALALAQQIASAGIIDERAVQITFNTDPLDQFRAVKAVTEAAP